MFVGSHTWKMEIGFLSINDKFLVFNFDCASALAMDSKLILAHVDHVVEFNEEVFDGENNPLLVKSVYPIVSSPLCLRTWLALHKKSVE